jgi:PEP-CTERM motif
MKSFIVTAAAASTFLLGAVPASAANVYMTGAGDPWGQSTNEAAMDAAFGAGNWTKSQGFSAAVFATSSFIFMDGGDAQATEFGNFVSANGAAFGSFLSNGGRVLVHAAPNQDDFLNYVLPNGLTLDGINGFNYPTQSNTASLTGAGVTAGLGAFGAGTSWTGTLFSHNNVTGGTCLITGDNGCILAKSGNLWAGGETTTNFHSPVAASFQLRVNELKLASAGAVPEPATWTMMILGFGGIGSAMRRRNAAVRTKVSFA